MAARRALIRNVMGAFSQSPKCAWHGGDYGMGRCCHANATQQREYAFEFTASSLRFGPGVTRELGQDLSHMGAKRVLVLTDPGIAKLSPFTSTIDSLAQNKINYNVFDRVRVEPTDQSLWEAIEEARRGKYDGFVAVGGGSTMDTAKAAALYAAHPKAEFLDFVGPPFGRNQVPTNPLKPLICIPTTAGTGSETTAVSVFDLTSVGVKTGIRNRMIKPKLGLVDPLHMKSMPTHVAIYSGFDVLCHALESYTTLPFNERLPAPTHPAHRPVYQGRNAISDVWAKEALRIIRKYFKRAVANPDDLEARSNMLLASSFAGLGFGNAGVHLCHGLSYAISGHVKEFHSPDYVTPHPLVPHGLSVVMTAPADFEFTGPVYPERHLEAASILGADVGASRSADAGKILADAVREFMVEFSVPNGLKALGYTSADIPLLTKSSMPTMKATLVAPKQQTEEEISNIFEKSMVCY